MDASFRASALNISTLSLRSQEPPVGDAYLQFRLDPQTPAVLLMRQVQEVLVLPVNRLTALPGLPACVMGLMNRRSRIFWVVDLAHLLKRPPLILEAQQCNIIILNVGTTLLGIAVASVQGISRLTAEQIQASIQADATGLGAYLQGCVLYQGEIIQVLNAEAIVNSPILLNS